MKLIIVESPTKARTLSRFLGENFTIEATMGHIKDLPKSTLGVDLENNFKPEYIEVKGKGKTIKQLKTSAKKADEIYIATDPDREGEAIASHVSEVLMDGKKERFSRIVFHEITKEAVEEAISHPGTLDSGLVDAQTARRVLDRLVGYKLSPLLWKKIRRGLSAGRVQSVAVRLIVEKEREIEKFKPIEYWEISCDLETDENKNITVWLAKISGKKAEIGSGATADSVVSDLKKAKYSVSDIRKREVRANPYPPFTTSTMSQTGARILKWSAKKTMSVAQKLYEEGLITYHRTDSTNIAKIAMDKVRGFIAKKYGENYLPDSPRFYKTKAKVAQEAHEAIRPTDVNVLPDAKIKVDGQFANDAAKLYQLIWTRFVSCQMAASLYDETAIDVEAVSELTYLLRVSGRIMRFDGWRKIMTKIEEEIDLPNIMKGESLNLLKVNSTQKFTQPPARFNEASLIKMLESLGIGRPSTYAPIITTIQARNYVEKDEGKFTPTSIGIAVNDFLTKNFPKVFDYSFTATMESSLDEVATGEVKWTGVIGNFWKSFSGILGSVEKNAERVKIAVESTGKKCPDCKDGDLVVRIGRFGKFISCSKFPDCKHTERFVEKVEMKCPDCTKGDVVIKRTKKGRKFFGCSNYPDCKWASWRKPQKPQVDKPA